MTDAILAITDGTTRISLINPSSGFLLNNWIPAIPDYKGGGVFQNPPLADWRQLRSGNWATYQEAMGLHVNGANPDGIAFILQELRRLLLKADDYWKTDWQNDPVWLEAKAKCETNTRYTIIVKGRLGNDRSYFSQPFTGEIASMQDLPLEIEHRAWLANQPGSGTATAISAVETYNGINYGNVDDTETREPTTGKVYLANRRNSANITNIHLTTAGANVVGSALPHDIINATGETYFGIDTSVSDSGPFSSLVFDIGTAGVGGPTIVWEYWNGAAWSAISSLIDKTSDFTVTGVNIISWSQPSNWATTTPGGALPTGYWVRARISAGSFSTEPTQQNREVYAVVWPYTEIQITAVGGDIPTLNQIKLYGDGCTSSLLVNWFVVGLRSMSRGTSFTAYLNAADEQNPAAISITLGPSTAYATTLHSSTGRSIEYSPGANTTNFFDIVQWTIDNTLSEEYLGDYHAYLRISTSSGISGLDEFRVRLSIKFDATQSLRTNYSQISVTGYGLQLGRVLDMGEISIRPSKLFSGEAIGEINIYASIAPVSIASETVGIYDLILIPIDEWAVESSSVVNNQGVIRDGLSQYLDMDSVHDKHVFSSTVRSSANDEKIMTYRNVYNGPSILQANSRQRLWFLSKLLSDTSAANDIAEVEAAIAIEVSTNPRYLSLRGER